MENEQNRRLCKSDFIMLDLDKDIMLQAAEYALQHADFRENGSGFSDNLRKRSPAISLDTAIRGQAAELGFRKLLNRNGIVCEKQERLGKSGDVDLTVIGKKENVSMEIKSSLLPDNTLQDMDLGYAFNLDIKIFAPYGSDASRLERDVYVQIYYSISKQAREDKINKVMLPDNPTAEEIYKLLDLEELINRCIFVGWISKNMEKHIIKGMDEKTWAYGKREFLKSPLHEAFKPCELFPFLQGL